MKKYALLGLALFVSACASLETMSTDLSTKWAGRSYDEFVMEHGAANTNHKLQNGTVMYRWEKAQKRGPCTLNILVGSDNRIQKITAAGDALVCSVYF